MVEIKNLTKYYGQKAAVKNISFTVEDHEILGFLGPNGAGKSTTMNIICGVIPSSSGTVTINGFDIAKDPIKAKRHIGFLPEIPPVYPDMKVKEYLTFVAGLKGVPGVKRKAQVAKAMDRLRITDVAGRLIRNLSKGYRQRVGFAQALLGEPDVLILDEPINALDPEGIREMRTLFQRLNQEDGTTIFISSHILSEVDLLADTIGIIQHGKLLTELPIEEIHKHQTDYISLQVDDVTRVAALLENMRITNFSVLDKEFIHIYDSDISGKALSKAIIENGIGLESMGRKQDTLEDFFFQLTEEEK